MEKNWIVLGDAAFDSKEEPIGILKLTDEEVADWRSIAVKRIKSVVSEKVMNLAKEHPYISICAMFYKDYMIRQEDFGLFTNEVANLFEGVKPILCEMDYSQCKEDNAIMISFYKNDLPHWLGGRQSL